MGSRAENTRRPMWRGGSRSSLQRAEPALAQAEINASGRKDAAEYRRAKVDIEIQAALGEFFAAKFRGGVLFHLYEISREAGGAERRDRAVQEGAVGVCGGGGCGEGRVHRTMSRSASRTWLRGHWLDRLPAMDKDIAAAFGNAGGGGARKFRRRWRRRSGRSLGTIARASRSMCSISRRRNSSAARIFGWWLRAPGSKSAKFAFITATSTRRRIT